MKKPLSFKNGMTNNPSDLVCSDDCLAVEIGAEWNGNAHKAIQYPKEVDSNFLNDIAIIHDFANYTHIISVHDTKLWWCDFDVNGYASTGEMHQIAAFDSSVISAQAIGNTVILNTSDGLLYLLWKNDTDGYKALGGQLPEIQVRVGVDVVQYQFGTLNDWNIGDYEVDLTEYVSYNGSDAIDEGQAYYYNIQVTNNSGDLFKTALIGIVTKCENKVKENNHFLYPFWVRFAYRLYDGSNAMITNPILVLPTVTMNRDIVYHHPTLGPGTMIAATFQPYAGDLIARIYNDISDWEDIISGVDVFVSDGVRSFNLEGDYTPVTYDNAVSMVIADRIDTGGRYQSIVRPANSFGRISTDQKGEETMIKELIDKSVFYKVLELDRVDLSDTVNISSKMAKNTLLNLTSQLRLEHDDYFGHCAVDPGVMLTYNGRLQLGDIKRGFFDGFKHFITLTPTHPNPRTADVYVEIQSQSGTRVVKQQVTGDAFAYWFYYPDPRAKNVYIIIGGNKYKLPLKEHPGLNGAYYFGHLPSADADNLPTAEQDSTAPTLNNEPEVLANQIITSEVNNPFVYNVDGANDVGSGRIQGLVTNTQALSEGQFGQHPLIAFTDEGIWALTTNSEGLYNSVVPLSREVCSNPDSITQTDNAIFFATEKGLMILVGSKVQCVSELLDGKDADIEPFLESGEDYLTTPFRDVLQNGKIAYDYKNKRLWIYHESNIWTFNIASKTFAQVHSTDPWVGHSILYPDCIVQTYAGKLLSLLKTDNINDDLNEYDARLITRPIKFGDALTYKTIFRMQHLWLGDGTFTTRLWGSDDLKNWSRLISLHGRPWRYYTFRLDFSGMKATDAYHGLVAELQPRHTNRLHTEPEPE